MPSADYPFNYSVNFIMKKLHVRKLTTSSVDSLDNVALVPEVQIALSKWIKAQMGNSNGVLIGGIALSFYTRPRYTSDIDLLFLSKSTIPSRVTGFKAKRKGAFQEDTTHVEVETVYPEMINLPIGVARMVIDKSVDKHGLHVASLEGLIVLKLYAAESPNRYLQDMADIVNLVRAHPSVSLIGWPLKEPQQQLWNEALRRSK